MNNWRAVCGESRKHGSEGGRRKRTRTLSWHLAGSLPYTMFGPHVETGSGSRKQAKLIAFIDDASRVLCHGEFFFDENVDTLVQALRAAFYKRGVPEQLLVDNGSIYVPVR